MRTFTITIAIAVLALLAAAAPGTAHADGANDHDFGVGLMLGAPTGLSAKYRLGTGRSPVALQFGLGVVERIGDDGTHVHADLLWQPAMLAKNKDLSLPFYFGVGLRLLDHDAETCFVSGGRLVCSDYDDDTHLGVRVPFGLALELERTPIDIFLELAMVVDIVRIDDDDPIHHEHDDVYVNGAIGARFYF